MSSGELNYGRFMERAMRGVMAEILGHVAEEGLKGEHHFFITFDTTHPGVDIPGYLRARYPREMMIVLQHWFDDLAVTGDRFRVTLNFSDNAETLVVPFDSVKTFIDPSAKFGLKFDGEEEADEGSVDEDFVEAEQELRDEADEPVEIGEGITANRDGPDGGSDRSADDDKSGDGEGGERQSADVVSIDRFRKT